MRWLAILIATAAVPLCLEGELLPIRSYTTADGLAADAINKIVVDSHGFVWFCTPEGLSRFDGYRIGQARRCGRTSASGARAPGDPLRIPRGDRNVTDLRSTDIETALEEGNLDRLHDGRDGQRDESGD